MNTWELIILYATLHRARIYARLCGMSSSNTSRMYEVYKTISYRCIISVYMIDILLLASLECNLIRNSNISFLEN